MTYPQYKFCRTNYVHPEVTTGQHTNGPAVVWIQHNGEWICTRETHLHRVREWLEAFGDEYIEMLKRQYNYDLSSPDR